MSREGFWTLTQETPPIQGVVVSRVARNLQNSCVVFHPARIRGLSLFPCGQVHDSPSRPSWLVVLRPQNPPRYTHISRVNKGTRLHPQQRAFDPHLPAHAKCFTTCQVFSAASNFFTIFLGMGTIHQLRWQQVHRSNKYRENVLPP